MSWGCRGPTEPQFYQRFSLQIRLQQSEHQWSPTVVDRSLLALPVALS
jgi:hypothetical protein